MSDKPTLAVDFDGDFSSLRPDRLREFKPWNKD